MYLNHLENEQVAVSEADKQLRVAGRRIHPLQESLQGLKRERRERRRGGEEGRRGEKKGERRRKGRKRARKRKEPYVYISTHNNLVILRYHPDTYMYIP